MNFATYNAIRTNFIKAYDATNGAGSAEALPPGFLQAIITAILAMVSQFSSGCVPTPTPTPTPTPAVIKLAVADPINVPYMIFIAHRELVDSLGRQQARRVNAAKCVAAFQEAAAASDDATVQGVIDAVNS